MNKRLILMLLCAACWPAGQAKAAGPLGLWDCVELAVKTHAYAEAGRWAVRGAREQLASDNTLLRPTLSTDFHYTTKSYVPKIPIPTNPISLGDHHDAGVEVGASYLLYDWKRRDYLLDADRRDIEAAARMLDSRRETLAYEAGSGYLLLQAARRNVEIANSAIATAEAHLKDVQALLDHGLTTPDVALKAKVRVEQAKVEADRQQNTLEVSRANLLLRIGRPVRDEVEFGNEVGDIPEPVDIPMPSVFSARPDLQSYEFRLSSLESRAAMLAAGNKPSLRVFAAADYARPGLDQFRNEWIAYGVAGVALHWEFYDWGRSSHDVDRTEAKRMELANDLRIRKAQVALEVKTARLDLEHAANRVTLAGNAKKASEEHFRVVGNLFEQGQVTSSEYLDAQEEVTVSSLDLSRAEYEHDLARWRLALACGELEKEVERRWPESTKPMAVMNMKKNNQQSDGGSDERN